MALIGGEKCDTLLPPRAVYEEVVCVACLVRCFYMRRFRFPHLKIRSTEENSVPAALAILSLHGGSFLLAALVSLLLPLSHVLVMLSVRRCSLLCVVTPLKIIDYYSSRWCVARGSV